MLFRSQPNRDDRSYNESRNTGNDRSFDDGGSRGNTSHSTPSNRNEEFDSRNSRSDGSFQSDIRNEQYSRMAGNVRSNDDFDSGGTQPRDNQGYFNVPGDGQLFSYVETPHFPNRDNRDLRTQSSVRTNDTSE